ncbi:MAG: hypothetical protein LBV72_18235 [Tannerella sp.]|nr:hypothetical protein [Tannerella sp.]
MSKFRSEFHIEVKFEEGYYFILFNSKEVLDSRYKYWKSKVVVYFWSHFFEKNILGL